jgi:hypothetical protein
MLGSITPLGERGRNSRWAVTMAAFVVGSAAGGAALGTALGSLGAVARTGIAWWTPTVSLVVLGTVALAGAALDARLVPVPMPTVRRQVDERWLQRYRGWVYGLGFGLQLGMGVVTIVTTATVYAAFAAALLSGSTLRGAVIGGTFGVLRAATSFSVARVRRPEQVVRIDALLRRFDGSSRGATVALEAGLAVTALAAAAIGW